MISSVSPASTSPSASSESPTLLPSLVCCDTKMTYSSSGYPEAFYLKVAETNATITDQCPGSCVYVKYDVFKYSSGLVEISFCSQNWRSNLQLLLPQR